MERRQMLAGLAASALAGFEGRAETPANNMYLELKTWRLHNTHESQASRVSEFLESGLGPGLWRAGAKLAGAFANVIGPDGPYYVTLSEFPSLGVMQEALSKLRADEAYQREVQKLSAGSGLPFVRVESSLLQSFYRKQLPTLDTAEKRASRIFELRTYESQSFVTLARKIGMFHGGEIQIFERLGMRPVFFGETIVGPKQPCLTYMLSYDDLAARDKLWHAFGSDPEWKRLSSQPQLKDAEIVENISNVILRPLSFSAIR